MQRARSIALLASLLLAGFAAGPARADSAPVVDAGDSRLAYDGAPLVLQGEVRGGVPPYVVTWSTPTEPGRIFQPEVFGTTYNTSGLVPQDVVFTLTVTDANGATASDAVRHRVESAPVLVRRNVSLTFGVPDEIVGAGLDERVVFFQLPAGLARIVATLDWTHGPGVGYDLDFELEDPSGATVSGGQGVTGNKPERVVLDAPAPGAWTARILPFFNGPTTARFTVQAFPLGTLPTIATGSFAFGRLDEQRLVATATGSGVAIAWDLDGDGAFETPGAEVVASLPVGDHVVRARATDAAGFEVSTTASVRVRPADTILRMRCGADSSTPFWAMEFTSSKDTCWIHGGHHTYFAGDIRYGLRHASGFVFTVEQQLSPPTEHRTDEPGATPLHVEVSLDGLSWTEIAHGEYRFLPDVAEGDFSVSQRQRVDIVASADGVPFRFLRIWEPRSAAQGLSGYLDHSELDVEVDVLGPVAAPALAPGVRALDCSSAILEDFFPEHPCWFGGLERWDAPSFWHTYFLGDGAQLDTLSGEFTLLPWRTDDWNQGNTTENATGIAARVQTSVDGVRWTDVAWVQTTTGAPTAFALDLGDHPARFVRLFPEYHARVDQTQQFAPNHHPKGFFVDSRIVVGGLLPS